jgi:hypothetical protein
VASQVVTLDQLSGGRAILTVGLGAIATDLPDTGEEIDLHTRAAQMDEGIDLIRALWDGGHAYQGRHYSYSTERNDLTEVAQPVQKRIPIWVVGVWNRPKSMRRVLHCDGIVPQYDRGREGTPDDLRDIRAWLLDHDASSGFDVIAKGETSADNRSAAQSGAALGGCGRHLVARDALGDAAQLRRTHGRDTRSHCRRTAALDLLGAPPQEI